MAEAPPPPRYDERLADALVDRALEAAPTLSTARLVAVDGPAGSGKTTLAAGLATRLRKREQSVEVVSMDDLYEGWTGLDERLEARVLDQVLVPLAGGGPARWQAYDWTNAGFGGWRDLPLPDVLLLEGCGAGARSYAPYTTVLLWVEAPARQRAERAVTRDGPMVLEHWDAWAAAERRTFTRNATRSRADVRLRT